MNRIDVSIIITTKNEERHIGDCLRSIKGQRYPQERIEIIVVDNNSIDNTKGIASRFNARVYNRGPERSAQRNFGISKSRGQYILYLDADMILNKEVISECVYKCKKDNLVALYIPEKIIGDGFWIKVRDFERGFYNATCIDCVRFVRRDKFLGIRGFDESLTGPEDWDFDRRMKQIGKTGMIDAPIYHNETGFCLSRYVRKKQYYAKSFNRYIKKWGFNDPIVKKQLKPYYRLVGVFIENHKWKTVLKHPLLALGMIYLRLRVGFAYVFSRMGRQIK